MPPGGTVEVLLATRARGLPTSLKLRGDKFGLRKGLDGTMLRSTLTAQPSAKSRRLGIAVQETIFATIPGRLLSLANLKDGGDSVVRIWHHAHRKCRRM